MARSFNGSSDYLEYGGAALTALPVTMACWGYKSTTTQFSTAVVLRTNGANNRIQLVWSNNGTLRAISVNTSNTIATATNTTVYPTNTWLHSAAVFTSTTSRTVYRNGVAGTTNTTSNDPSASSFDRTNIGSLSSASQPFDGNLAEVGIWNVALTGEEIASLSDGISPLNVRPASLIAYWPLIGNFSPEIDLRGRFEMTVSGATKADHPRVYKPAGVMIPRKAPVVTTSIPVLYRQRQQQGMAA